MSKSKPTERRTAAVRRGDDPAQPGPYSRGPGQESTEHRTSVRLTRKYAEMIDGVDLTEANVGDELTLPTRDAGVLIAEGWAEPAPKRGHRSSARREEWASSDRAPHKRTPR